MPVARGWPAALFLAAATGCNRDAGSAAAPTPTAPVVTAARPAADPPGPDWFADRTAGSGIEFAYRNGEEVSPPHLTILESLGGGGAALDFDGDGRLDLYLCGGGRFAGADRRTIEGLPGRLYRNLGGFRFQDVTAAAGLDALAGGRPWFYSHGAAVADYDRDGWPDLLVTGYGRVALFHNEPDGKGGRRFADVSAAAGLDRGVTWATSAGWADFDGDGRPDLYVCQYVDWSWAKHPDCTYDGKTADVCPPKRFDGLPHKVFRNLGGGRFEDVSATAGLVPGGPAASKGLGLVVADVNADGKPDVYAANDTVANLLYVNRSAPGAIRFEERGMLSGVALDGSGSPNGSMGADAGDPDGTGRPSLWCTNYENELHALYRNVSAGDRVHFLFATPAAGIAAIGQQYVGWGTAFLDLDLDGWEDLFVSNGHAVRFPVGAPRRQRPVLLRNAGGGKFADASARGGAYFREPHLGRGVVFADWDDDGRVDAVVCHTNEPAAVLQNVAPTAGRHWVGVALAGRGHADVVGARVILEAGGRTQTRFAKGGGSYASSADRRLVFGLGATDRVTKLTVVWPDGSRQEWADVPIDRYHVATQGETDLRPYRKGE
jgi:hypothetical protein